MFLESQKERGKKVELTESSLKQPDSFLKPIKMKLPFQETETTSSVTDTNKSTPRILYSNFRKWRQKQKLLGAGRGTRHITQRGKKTIWITVDSSSETMITRRKCLFLKELKEDNLSALNFISYEIILRGEKSSHSLMKED